MKNVKMIIAFLLVFTLLLGNTVMASASETSKGKEEVIYVTLDADGTVNSVNAVNIFSAGDVTDYGNYSEVKLLNSSAKITADGDKISFTTDKDRVYYQGTMAADTPIPWVISLSYVLDGKAISPEELAGADGALKICFKVEQNPLCESFFYDNYALQATFKMDTGLCKNINAEDATAADADEDKQLTYTILPGKGIDTVISADVHNFEMEAVTINGISLNLDIEIDDEELMSSVNELMDAISELNDGTSTLYDGTTELKSGSRSISAGTGELYTGITSLDGGIGELKSGILTMQKGLNKLDSKSASLTTGSKQMISALTQIQAGLSGISDDTDSLTELVEASSEIATAVSDLNSGAAELYEQVGFSQYKAVMLENGLDIDQLTEGNEDAAAGLTSAAAALSELNVPSVSVDLSATTALLMELAQDPAYAESAAAALAELNTLSAQMETVSTQLNALEGLSENATLLTQSAALLKADNAALSGADSYLTGVSENLESLADGLDKLNRNYTEFNTAISSLASQLEGMVTNLTTMKTGIDTLVKEYKALDSGINTYTEGVTSLVAGYKALVSGTTNLASGSSELLSGADELKDGMDDFYDGVTELCDGASELNDGMSTMNDETSDMDTTVQDRIDSILASVGGTDFVPESFTSEKNTNVESVQFAIKTEAIEIQETEEDTEAAEEHLNLWQKFLSLFGID